MGRTVTPYSIQLQLLEERYKGFRRSLRKDDQVIFDDLMRIAKLQVQAGVMASNPNPADSVFLSVLIELKKKIDRLENELKKLKEPLLR